jgi:hypothetical protein
VERGGRGLALAAATAGRQHGGQACAIVAKNLARVDELEEREGTGRRIARKGLRRAAPPLPPSSRTV